MAFRAIAVIAFALSLVGPAAAKPTPVPLNKVVEWKTGAAHVYTAGDLTLTFRPKSARAHSSEALLTIAKAKGPSITYPFIGGFESPQTQFAVGRFDPKDPNLEVLLGPYTGGAHCCLQRRIFVLAGGKWKVLEIPAGLNTDQVELPKDVDGDGTPDFVLFDDRFAYQFGCFACSAMPPRIFFVRSGALVDASASRKYDAIFRRDLTEAKAACAGKDTDKGLCAGVAADGARLGAFEENWRWMLTHYPRGSDWDYPQGCKVAIRDDQECPKGKEINYADFPESLAWFLKRNGYITEAQARWAVRESKRK